MFSLAENTGHGPVIKVIGIGGAGRNAVEQMHKESIEGANFICANTDSQAMLYDCDGVDNIQLGAQLTGGLGAGSNPEIGRQAAIESKEQLVEHICGADLVFIAAGMGGGTGTGAAPEVAQMAREHDVLTVAVVTTPFKYEQKARAQNAQEGLNELSKHINSLIVIDNNKLIEAHPDDMPLSEAFARANDVLGNAVRCITELVIKPGQINVDFADVKTVMSVNGMAVMGTGSASGSDRAMEAVHNALSSPLIDQHDMSHARGVIINVTTASEKLLTGEYHGICDHIGKLTDSDAQVISGTVYDDDMGDALRVSVIAAGLQGQPGESRRSRAGQVRPPPRPVSTGGGYKPVPRPQQRVVNSKAAAQKDMVSIPAFLRDQAD